MNGRSRLLTPAAIMLATLPPGSRRVAAAIGSKVAPVPVARTGEETAAEGLTRLVAAASPAVTDVRGKAQQTTCE